MGPGGGILIQTEGAQSDVTIATGAITGGISVTMGQLTSAGRNLSVTTNGNVVGGIGLRTAGTGTVDVTTNAPVTGGISLRAGNAANTSAFTVNLNQSVAGDVSLQNSGTGTTTVRTGNITGGILTVNGGGANSSLVVDGNITRTGIADERFGSSLAEVNFGRGGTNTATFNGAIFGTFDTTATVLAPSTQFSNGLSAGLGTTSANGSATLNVNGSIAVTAIAQPGGAANVRGASLSSGGIVPVDFNLHGAVSATSISDTASTVIGIAAAQSGVSTLRLTAGGNVTATASAAGSDATGIAATAFGSTNLPNTQAYIIRANGDVTATSDGVATGISLTRGSAVNVGPDRRVGRRGSRQQGDGDRELDQRRGDRRQWRLRQRRHQRGHAVAAHRRQCDRRTARRPAATASSPSAAAPATSRSTCWPACRARASVSAHRAPPPATSSSRRAAMLPITGVTGITTSGGTTTLVNNGTITGTGGTAVQFGGTNDVLAMLPGGGTFNGNVVGNGSSILQLGGTTAAAFDLSKLGSGAQFSGFSNLAIARGHELEFCRQFRTLPEPSTSTASST